MSTVVDAKTILSLTASSIAASQTYNVGRYDSVVYQLNYTDATPAPATFAASAVTVGVRASGTITVTDYTKLAAADTITIGSNVGVANTDWNIGASNNATATNIA